MAGHEIALLRILRLKNALQSTVTSAEFRELRVFEKIAHALMQEEFWEYLFVMCRAMYAPMRVLRLADQKTAAMDKLHYFVLQTERMLPKYLEDAEDRSERLLTDGVKGILADTTDAASIVVDSDGDESDDEESDVVNHNVSQVTAVAPGRVISAYSSCYLCVNCLGTRRRRTGGGGGWCFFGSVAGQ